LALERYTEGYCPAEDGTQLYYALSGPRETQEVDIVLCDGLACDGFIWKYLKSDLSRRHRVLRWHYRGHGRSQIPDNFETLTIPALADDLARVMDAAGLERAVVAGHSLGVQVAIEMHRRHPERVAGLGLFLGASEHPVDRFDGRGAFRASLPYMKRLFTGFPHLVVEAWSAFFPSSLAFLTAIMTGQVNRSLIRWEDIQPYFDHLARMDPEVFVHLLTNAADHSAKNHLPDVDVPTLVIGAELDSFIPVWLAEAIADAVPDAELMIVPKGSHAALIEQPELTFLRVEKFLRERLGSYSQPVRPSGPAKKKSSKKPKTRPAEK